VYDDESIVELIVELNVASDANPVAELHLARVDQRIVLVNSISENSLLSAIRIGQAGEGVLYLILFP
jgi:hypothetical protein